MEQDKYTKHFDTELKIGLVNWREAWLFAGEFPEKLYTEASKGKLVFRQRGTSLHISYQRLKKGLIKKAMLIRQAQLPF
ncbi:MAG: hypothetical protein ACT4OJ_12365 [Bacteroidota bacterium]